MSAEEQEPVNDKRRRDLGPEARTKRQVAGAVIATPRGSSKALIRLETGAVVEAVGAEQLEDLFEVGATANVYFDSTDTVLGWALPDLNVGVNLERSESE